MSFSISWTARRKEENCIAIFHCPIQIIKRSVGRSAVAAAAYRSGERLTNEWDGKTHDYTHKPGVVHTEIILPAHAPPKFQNRSTLWNSVEQIEKVSDAQLAREIEVALPVELSRAEQLSLVRSLHIPDREPCLHGVLAPPCRKGAPL